MKRGITILTLTLVVIIMSILTGVGVYFSDSLFQKVDKNEFILEFLNIQTASDNYYITNNKYPTLSQVEFDVQGVEKYVLEQFEGEEFVNNKVQLRVLDLEELGITQTIFEDYDSIKESFAVSIKTGRVYYINGISFEDDYVHYSLNDELYELSDIYLDTKGEKVRVKDAIFVISDFNETKEAVVVTIVLPKKATINNMNITNSVTKGMETTYGDYQVMKINTAGLKANYEVEVAYTLNNVNKTAKYVVNNVDAEGPVIETSVTKKSGYATINLNISDNDSESVVIKYEYGNITDYNYFDKYGKYVHGTEINCYKNGTYTVYAMDDIGNITLKQVQVTI